MAACLTINGASAVAESGLSIFDQAEQRGIQVPTSCRKQGKCKECVVEVSAGMELLSARTDAEQHLKGAFRLSCQTSVVGVGDVVCHTMRRGEMHIVSGSHDLPVLRAQPDLRPGYGIAMDLGTTTIVLRLFDLSTGALVADASFENPQRFGGSDVLARISYDTANRGGLLMRTLAGYLTHTIEAFPVDPQEIREMVVVGNSTMRDMFFRLNVYSIGQNPYRSITEIEMAEGKRASTSLVSTGRQSLLPIHPQALVYGAPIISGHVGADAAACMLAVDIAHEDRLVCVMDIGTNTELILGNRRRILAASCPAGPAFEGGAISCGMPALPGAISDIALRADGARGPRDAARSSDARGADGEFDISVIGGGAPTGIAGSGLVDLLSELLRTGRMNSLGRFADDEHSIEVAHGITFLESDVNELAQAKAANSAGLRTILSNYGASFEDIDVFYLAGGFGRHLKIDASRRIGLIPDLPDAKIVQVGNAAMEGASIALLSLAARRELEETVKRVEHCRLETHPDFFDFFVEGCQFKLLSSQWRVAA